MQFSHHILTLQALLCSTIASPVASPDAVVGAEYASLTQDLPADLALRDPNISEAEHHSLLSKRGCDPIGCYSDGYFSVIFSAAGGTLFLYGEGQDRQSHGFACSGAWNSFNSWLPYVFSTKEEVCGIPPLFPTCCNLVEAMTFKYGSIETNPAKDTRCGPAGSDTQRRCIFPIRP